MLVYTTFNPHNSPSYFTTHSWGSERARISNPTQQLNVMMFILMHLIWRFEIWGNKNKTTKSNFTIWFNVPIFVCIWFQIYLVCYREDNRKIKSTPCPQRVYQENTMNSNVQTIRRCYRTEKYRVEHLSSSLQCSYSWPPRVVYYV